MSSPDRQDEPLYGAKVTAGWLSVAFLLGLLWVAVDRGPNQAYIPLVAFTVLALVIGLVIGMRRHARRQRVERAWQPKRPVLGSLMTAVGLLGWIVQRVRKNRSEEARPHDRGV